MVPMLTCGLVRSNFAFATGVLLRTIGVAVRFGIRWSGRLRVGPTPNERTGPACCGTGQVLWSRCCSGNSGSVLLDRYWLDGAVLRRGVLPAGLLDDLLRDVLRDLGVGVELHRVHRPALRLAAQVADVPEHLRQRHQGPYHLGPADVLHGLDLAAA